MAKFSRFDPRNKKKNRNKIRSLDKDIRMHEERKSRKYAIDETFIEEDDVQGIQTEVYYKYQE